MSNQAGVNSFDEWSPLKEVIVGSPIGYKSHNIELSFKLFNHDVAFTDQYVPTYDRPSSLQTTQTRSLRESYLKELSEDIDQFIKALEGHGVCVHRPAALTKVPSFQTPYWKSRGIPALNVRDRTIILGRDIVETAPLVRARYFETDLLKSIFYKYFNAGSGWVSMPMPIMTDKSFDASYVADQVSDFNIQAASEHDIGFEMMIDGANCIRLGKDVIVNVANKNHELGLQWLERQYGDTFRFHRVYRFADSHLDSKILPLRPGLFLVRRLEYRDRLPKFFRKWDFIIAPEPTEGMFPAYDNDDLVLTSKFIDLNVLSLDENTVIVNSLAPELCNLLDKHGFTVIPVRHRHRRIFSGGFHCFTLDTVREGSQPISYFD